MHSSNGLRQQFIDFFIGKHAHTNVPSSPVVPHDDPTLLFANAGMNQFKPYFLGTEKPPITRAVNTQKCIRAGGKHNDLDDVGKDTYHHTFFEMLGNWSFGDYFKQEAIDWAWELLVEQWKLDPARLYATYFEGDEKEGLEPDHQARDFWRKLLPDDHVLPGNKKDNFWEMGDTGPCGPCSELHYDGRPPEEISSTSGGGLVNADHPDVIEIWNLVFIQFNRNADGSLAQLPAQHVDTGMGFERIVRVIQGKDSNYDTDVFTPIFKAIQDVTGARAYQPGGSGKQLTDPINIAYRVIADHIRTLAFALTDGAHCGNDGRSYVLRRILRRAVRYGRQTLGVKEPFFYKLVATVVDTMGDAFPELKKNPDAIVAEIQEEEESFGRTLDRGIALFDEAAEHSRLAGDQRSPGTISAHDAFQLHDTYGFPLDLTQLMASERGMTVDVGGFERLMQEAREKSRAGGSCDADSRKSLVELVQKGGLPETEFVGYDHTELSAFETPLHVLRVGSNCGLYKVAEKVSQGRPCAVVVGKTPFYAEQGGQVGDTGTLQINAPEGAPEGGGARVKITDTIKVGDITFHLGEVVAGTLVPSENAKLSLAVDRERRAAIMANHTATHVMNRALRDHVNPDADQRGSLVDAQKLRFDFTQNHALTAEQIAAVEQQVNTDIAADLPVFTQNAPQEKAIKINGLRAVFGEKYPPQVRVVSIGASVADLLADPDNTAWASKSIEFCGGTHLPSTGQAQRFCIVSQESVSKGVRRVTALTGNAALDALREGEQLAEELGALADVSADKLPDMLDGVTKKIEAAQLPLQARTALRSKLGEANERVKQHRKAQGDKSAGAVVEHARRIAEEGNDDVIVAEVPEADGKTLRTAMDVIRKKRPEAAMLLAASAGGKVSLLASVPEAKIKAGLKAGDWIKHVAPIVGGGGGGRPDMAQAGGKDPGKLPEALDAATKFAQAKS